MGRHRHVTCVRADGLSTVLAALLEDRRVVAATLVDADSGLVLDACTREGELADLELLGAGHADLARAAPAVTGTVPDGAAPLSVGTPDGRVHLLREVPDPHGDRLVLTAVVAGGARAVVRARQRLAAVPVEALTAGPTLQRRPVDGRWLVGPAEPDVPAVAPEGLPGLEPVVPAAGVVTPEQGPVGGEEPAPPPAMVPVVVTSAPGPARWAGTTAGDEPEAPDDGSGAPGPGPGDPDHGSAGPGDVPEEAGTDGIVPSPREEPAGADV